MEKDLDHDAYSEAPSIESGVTITDNVDGLQRHLNNRQIQLIAIGGSIGTAIFISIGNGLAAGGPLSLLLAYTIYSCVMACITNSVAEMVVLYPVSGGFIRLASHFTDEALGFMVGWNFFIYEALLIPFEITAINLVLSYWRDDIPVAAVCAAVIAAYASTNVLAVRGYGEAEFWLSSGKVILIFILFLFTFVTMVGGNPQKDAYGFRHWANPFAENSLRSSRGDLSRFEGFLACLWNAAFTVVGPEYIAMVAAETKRPRAYIKTAYKVMYWRFVLFFVVSAFCVGTVVAWNDPKLQSILHGGGHGAGTAAASPYVIAMSNLGIEALPHVVNALIITSIFSAGNTYTYCASRTLYSLALSGHAPKVFTKTTRKGVPILALAVTMLFPFLSFLQLSGNSSTVLVWLIDVITAGALIDFTVICTTYLMFYRACRAQYFDRRWLPYTAWFQPYCAWIGAIATVFVCLCYGYTSFVPWSMQSFFRNYTLQIFNIVLFLGWKLAKKTRWQKAKDIDLVWERPVIDAYEASFTDAPNGFWTEVLQLFGMRRGRKDSGQDIRP
ncbi:uncharacterized protein HMPREF1541_03549 [Cyphellophora europaea CBS 101466]|uniref:Amino acid permease/ SLC12A domain-containing protein n=1 Tax=Cyphellophora europaea (strain CBS 101466) TaxID=1220924 RepID=W2S0P1_CYPE1|nr:uncharacterized protein HMPREF1541_03549 [Cyphellophora europaea CBS 101466]ETN41613.1 hypothetical protein HMPREF1541_03549 [Cyphellophora europaea CBS 101466]